MPEENGSDSPSGNPENETLRQSPRTDLPEQRIVSNRCTHDADDEEESSDSPTGKVHWINHATFYLSIILAVLTFGTVRVYFLQLQQMQKQTIASQNSAYAACVGAQIARQTLLELQSGGIDTHNSSAATVAQVAVTTRGESPIIAWGISLSAPTQPNSLPSLFDWKSWSTVNTIAMQGTNVGRSTANNARTKFVMQLLPHDIEPSLSNRQLPFSYANLGVWAWLGTQTIPAKYVDQNLKSIGPLTPDQLEDLRKGNLYLAAFGRNDYTDMFGIAHWQNFCIVLDQSSRFSSEPQRVQHEACDKYNNMDNNLVYSIPSQVHERTPLANVEDIKCVAPKD
ncbi:MAG: hypothetical protein WB424_05300 [Terracidiphilus sp.]